MRQYVALLFERVISYFDSSLCIVYIIPRERFKELGSRVF